MAITLDQISRLYPRAYHIAEIEALPTIGRHGLLSTTAILDLVGVSSGERFRLERRIRESSVRLQSKEGDAFTLRDQKAMSLQKLKGCLQDGLAPEDWLVLLNRQVFFWLERKRVERLLRARQYKDRSHLVLEFDTRKLVKENLQRVALAPMNTGATLHNPMPRGRSTIASLDVYPYEERRRRKLKFIAVELCIDYSLPDPDRFVIGRYIGSASSGLKIL